VRHVTPGRETESLMYAIIQTGGKQYRVQPGDVLAVERLEAEPGSSLELDDILLVAGDGQTAQVGTPAVANAVVRAEVVEHGRGDKIIVFRFKSKVRYRRRTGHRQALTRLRITEVTVHENGSKNRAAQAAPAVEAPAVDAAPAEA
jgi:large subunit ribosomal protein L21